MSDIFWATRPMCDQRGCDNVSSFHGFGKHLCWSCYARLLQNGGFYSLTQAERERTMQPPLTEKKSCGRVGQMELQWEEQKRG